MLAVTDRRNGNTVTTVPPLRVRSAYASNTTRIEQVVMEHLEPKGA